MSVAFDTRTASPARTMERAIDAGRDRMQELATSLQAGELTLAQWQQASTAELKSLHIMGALAGTGSDTLDHEQRQAVSAKLNEQSAYLWNLAGQIARGEQPLDGRFVARAGMYADAARNTFSEAERGQASADGMKWERRILGEAEHCPGCAEAAGQGWQPLGTLPEIGSLECLTNCQCGFEYAAGDEQPADDTEPDEEIPPVDEEADVPEPPEEAVPIEEQLTEPVGNQPPSDDEMADRIIAAATDYLESGPIREPRHVVSDAQAHKRHIAGIVNRIDEISLDAARKVHTALALQGDGTSKAHIRRALAAYLRDGWTPGFAAFEDGRWVTIEGTHVYVKGDGTIEKGPAGIVGKDVDRLPLRHGTGKPDKADKAATVEGKKAAAPAKETAKPAEPTKPNAPAAPPASAAPTSPTDVAKLHKDLAAKMPELSEEHSEAVGDYTSGAYVEINKSLREGRAATKGARAIPLIREAIASTPVLDQPIAVYRGLRLNAEQGKEFLDKAEAAAKSGGALQDRGFGSTTIDHDIAKTWATGGKGAEVPIVMHIAARHGLYIGESVGGTKEKEFVMQADTHMRVLGVEDHGSHKVIKMEQVLTPKGTRGHAGFANRSESHGEAESRFVLTDTTGLLFVEDGETPA